MTILKRSTALLLTLIMLLSFAACDTATTDSATVFPETGTTTVTTTRNTADSVTLSAVSLDAIPAYSGEPFIFINDNVPFFTDAEKGTTASFETYSPLDSLGRCGVTFACVGKDIMPTESRGDISSVKPSGWHNEAYDFVDGRYVYNRCHLLGFQLTGENANERNLITGTRYMNVDGMLPFENMVADYVKETGNHVLLRVTPLFNGDELVARGVLMEAYSVEDDGDGICYNVYCYNVQPGVTIDYATGYNHADNTGAVTQPSTAPPATYVLNTNTLKIHTLSCSSVSKIAEQNRQETTDSLDSLRGRGYTTCGNCF